MRAGRRPPLTDSELLTLAVAQVLLGVRSEARWLRLVPEALPGPFPYLPGQSGYNKRLRGALPLPKRVIRELAADTDLWADPVWLVDSTPVECARSRLAALRSALAGVAGYGWCALHARYFSGLRLHLIHTAAGLPIPWALANLKIDERQVLMCTPDEGRTCSPNAPTYCSWPTRATSPPNSTITYTPAARTCSAPPTAAAYPAPASSCSRRSGS